MTLEQSILEAIRSLPSDKQRELLEHANKLRQASAAKGPRRSAKGLWSDLAISLSAGEIDEARREIWKNFPRDGF